MTFTQKEEKILKKIVAADIARHDFETKNLIYQDAFNTEINAIRSTIGGDEKAIADTARVEHQAKAEALRDELVV